jgi:hypothetical protein
VKSVDRYVFVRLRDRARSRAQQSPRLWKEYKRRRRARPGGRLTLPLWLARLIWPLALLVMLPGILQRVGPASLLAMLALYCSGTIFLRAADLRNRLYRSTELVVALHYPLHDRDFFRWQLREWLISCLPLFLLSAASYSRVAVYGNAGTALASAVLGGLAQTAIVITLSLTQALWLTRIPTQPALALYALIAGIFFFPKELAWLGGQALAVLPAGWVNLWLASSQIGTSGVILILLGVGLLAAVDAWIVRSLEKRYPRTDVTLVLQHAFDDEAADELASASTNENENSAAFGRDYAVAQERFASLHNRTIVAEQLTTATFDWNAGDWTTRIAGRWLTPRQRLVAEFLSASTIDTWKGRLKGAVQLTALGVFLCAIPLAVPLWLSLCVFIIAAFTGAPVLGGTWAGLTPGWFGFARLQPLAGYPVGYVEASLSVMKLNAVRLLGFVPLALTAGLVIGWRYFGQPTTGLLISAQIVLTAFAVQPYCTLFLHSGGTNDTKRLNWTSLSFACTLIANAVIFIAIGIACFVFNRSLLTWILGPPAMVLVSLSMWRFYGLLYSRHQIDLIPAAPG